MRRCPLQSDSSNRASIIFEGFATPSKGRGYEAILGRFDESHYCLFFREERKLGSCPKSVIEVEVSFVQRLAGEVAGVNPRFI